MDRTPPASRNFGESTAPTSEDDSGVETKGRPAPPAPDPCRRNKRKSTEPRRLQFRWDSDDSDGPSSGDSGCQLANSGPWRPDPDPPAVRNDDSSRDSEVSTPRAAGDGRPRPRNYKSMSRQRRIEANARERTRVHTISAAFESLRRAVPAYAHNQKLSKLGILRIASAYILSLACLNDLDYSRDQRRPSFAECVDLCTRTIQSEGRTRRRTKD